LVTLPLVLLYFSFKYGYKPAWFFLIATLPVLAMGVLESLSDLHDFPVQQMHMYYYGTTFFELFILTIGLSIKFKRYQEERNYVYQQMLDKEITAREEERVKIAQDLHDRLGGLIAATKLQFKMVKDRLSSSGDTTFDTGMELLDNAADSVRQIAHNFSSSSLVKTGLLNALKGQYNEYTDPPIFINESGFEKRLPLSQEQPLYAIIQELITNAVKHANAQEILVLLKENEKEVGFDTDTTEMGMGLESVQFRVKEHLKGTVTIHSKSTTGTIIKILFKRIEGVQEQAHPIYRG
jgi:signal transduction histidine kinase